MEVSCFERDTQGQEIVNLSVSLRSNDYLLDAHRIANAIVCSLGVFLNILLAIIVLKCPAQMFRMKPILWFGIAADLSFAINNLITSPVACLGYGRWLAINSGLIDIKNPTLNGILMGLIGTATLLGWLAIPCQFLYRYYLVQHGDRPRGFKLAFFISVFIFVSVVTTFAAMNLYTAVDPVFLLQAQVILNNIGFFSVRLYNVHGGSVFDRRVTMGSKYFMFHSITGYIIIIYCSIKIRNLLRTRNIQMSAITKRLNQDIDRLLFAFVSTTIITSVLPCCYMSYAVSTCSSHLWGNLLVSWNLAFASTVNPCLAIYFIRPYRQTILGWIRGSEPTETAVTSMMDLTLAEQNKTVQEVSQ